MFLDIPTHSSEREIKAVAASYATNYDQAFSQTPRQWLDLIIDRKHHSALFEEYVVGRSQRDIEVDSPEKFKRWEQRLTAHSLGCVKRIADTEIFTSAAESTL